MRGIIILPDRNSHGKHDQTGAFLPEAQKFQRLHGIPDDHVVLVDLSKDQGARAAEVLAKVVALGKGEPIRNILFAGHGLRGFLPQLRGVTAPKLAGVLASTKQPDARVYLAACSTGAGTPEDPVTGLGGDGGFADGVRDAFCKAGSIWVRVFGHRTPGHAFINREIRVFDGLGMPTGGAGGRDLIEHGSKLWRTFYTRMQTTDLRFRIHLLSQEELEAELAA